MSREDDVKRVKRLSRKFVPRRKSQAIPIRDQDPRKARHTAREEIVRALEEEEEEDGLLEDEFFQGEPGEDLDNEPKR